MEQGAVFCGLTERKDIMIKLVTTRPHISFDQGEGFTVFEKDNDTALEDSGWWVRKDIGETIQKWNLQPCVERDRHGKVSKKDQTPYWCAYQDVILSNRWHPEDILIIHSNLKEGFTKAIKLKDESIVDVVRLAEEQGRDREQAEVLVGFLTDTRQVLCDDMERILGHLTKLLTVLTPQRSLWLGETS